MCTRNRLSRLLLHGSLCDLRASVVSSVLRDFTTEAQRSTEVAQRIIRICIVLILMATSIGVVVAQSASATLSGTVSDEAGAVIPSVNITVFNLSTALQRHAATDERGSYVLPLLPPGRYNVTAQRDGFTPVEIRNVVLNTGDQLALRIKLKVGEIGASVTIIEDPSSVQQSAAHGTIIDRHFVET